VTKYGFEKSYIVLPNEGFYLKLGELGYPEQARYQTRQKKIPGKIPGTFKK